MSQSLLLFVSLCAVLSVLLALVVLYPWFLTAKASDNRLMQVNVDSFYARLQELESDKNQGVIDETLYNAQVIELKRQLLDAQTKTQTLHRVSGKSRAIVLAWIPILAGMAYLMVGDRTPVFTLWQSQDKLAVVADELMSGKIDIPPEWATKDSTGLMSAIQTNVHKNANDPNRWMRLSELFLSLKANPQAIESLARAYRLDPDNDEIASTYAQVRFFANDGKLDDIARGVLNEVLIRNPSHEGAQMLMAMGETRAGNFKNAQAWVGRLRSGIASKSGDHSTALASLDELSKTIADQEQKASAGVQVAIDIDKAMLAKIGETDTLFVSITASGGGVPYAVQKLGVDSIKDGQVNLTLSDLNAMLPERTLSSARAENVSLLVNARISKSGDPIAQTGDLSANPVPLTKTQNQVSLVINQVVP